MTDPENTSGGNLTTRILVAMALALLVGTSLHALPASSDVRLFVVDGVLYIGGQVFLRLLKVLVVPVVFVSLVCGTAALEDVTRLGRVGLRTLALYVATTAVAVTLALAAGSLAQPGAGFDLATGAEFVARDRTPFADTLIEFFPSNPLQAMADGNMLQVIFFAGLFGMAITMAGDAGRRILRLFDSLNTVLMQMVMILMAAAPVGVFCLIARVFAIEGFEAFAPLARYFLVVLAVLLLHAVVTYSALLKLIGGLSPLRFALNVRKIVVVAFSTASSNATIPVTLETVEHRLGVDNSIASFTVPLGATINMDGTAIMQGVATAFIAQAYGIELSWSEYATVIFTATMASVGTAGVPGVGLVTLAMVLEQVGLPVAGIGLILGVDRLLDMVRTAVNVCGDAAVSCVVAKHEKRLAADSPLH